MRSLWRRVRVLVAVAAGGVVGAEARYALTLLNDDRPAFPWATLVENVTGCFLIGVLMAVLLELTAPHQLLRPFLGVGVLGGYTTFSAYAVEVRQLLLDDRAVAAASYLIVTPVAALVAVWLAVHATRATLARLRRGGAGSGGWSGSGPGTSDEGRHTGPERTGDAVRDKGDAGAAGTPPDEQTWGHP